MDKARRPCRGARSHGGSDCTEHVFAPAAAVQVSGLLDPVARAPIKLSNGCNTPTCLDSRLRVLTCWLLHKLCHVCCMPCFRDIKPPARPGSALGTSGFDDGLSANGSLAMSTTSGVSSNLHSSHHLAVVPPTPGTHRPSPLPSSRGAAAEAWGAGSHTPHGGGGTPSAGEAAPAA